MTYRPADPPLLFVKPQTISVADKKRLRAAGVIVIEVDDPSAVKFLRATPELEAGELLKLAGAAICDSQVAINSFGQKVARAIAKASGEAG